MLDLLFDLEDLDEDATVIDVISHAPREATDVPVEIAGELSAKLASGPRIMFHERYCLTCRFHDDGTGARILISY